MNYSIKEKSLLIYMSLISLIISTILAYPSPANALELYIEVTTTDEGEKKVLLSWEPAEGAISYSIYGSEEPYLESWGESLAEVGGEVTEFLVEDDFSDLGGRYFFQIVARFQSTIPDWLVLVTGDFFDGNIHIDPFYISKYEVTQEEYLELMPLPPGDEGFPPFIPPTPEGFGFPDNPTHPAERVSWFDAIEYCNRLSIDEGLFPVYSYLGRTSPDDWHDLYPGWNENPLNHTNVACIWEADGYRLPTEAEWNHAANAGIHPPPYVYSGSDDVDEVAWYSENSDLHDGRGRRTHPVGRSKEPNGLGIHDMSGNVWEWCWDIWDIIWPPESDNPRGAQTGTSRLSRGGSWDYNANYCTVSYRVFNTPVRRGRDVGFRLVRSNN